MKFTIEKNIILEALINVTKALSQKITLPVLNGIKFEINKKELNLLASDSELTIKVSISEKNIKNIEKEGVVIIQSKYILDVIKKMPSDIINFEADENKIKIYSETNEFNLNCYNVADYPNFKLDTNKNVVSIKSCDLKELINQTSYAMSNQELRPLLTGLNFKIIGNILECVATDSYRLSKKSLNIESDLEEEVNIVIPGKTINELEKIIDDSEDLIYINIFNNKLLFIYKNIYIQSNLLSGSYPQTSHFIPNDFAYMINMDLKTFYDAVDRASLLASNKDKNIIKLNIKEKEMLITSISSEIGKTEEKLLIDSNKIDKIEISISSKYLMEALKVIKDDNILLLLNSDDKPVIIKSINDENLIKLILPIKSF